jgi:predicted permease
MFFRKQHLERRLESEIGYHLDRVTQSYIAQGIDAQEARRRALVEFGGAAQIQEDLRDVHRSRWLADLRQDLAYAARTLRRSPGFLASAVMTLALGIGANTAIFSLIDALMLRPMPAVPRPAELVQLVRQHDGCEDCLLSYPLFEYFRDRLSSLSGIFAVLDIKHEITMDRVDEMVNGDEVSGDFYRVMGLAPAAGRLLGPQDDAAPTPVAVISYDYWRRRFGLDPAAIGKSFTYATATLTIVGVEPEGFEGIEPWRTREFTVPLSMSEQLGGSDSWWRREWKANFLEVMARRKPGVSMEQANAEIAAVFGAWRTDKAAAIAQPFDRNQFLKERAAALPGSSGLNGLRVDFMKPLSILMGIVGLVLLLACANLSGLLLARAASRQREISVRRALGAGNGRLTRQFLAESLLLAVCGALVGLAAAQWFSRALVTMMANGDELPLSVSPDWRVFAFTGTISLLACVFAGVAPGLSAGRMSVNPSLKEVRAGGGNRRLGRVLVASQLAISMTLLVGAGLFIRTLVKLYSVDTGVRTGGVFIFNVSAKHHYPPARSVEIESAIVDRLRSLPGVTFATAANVLPLTGGSRTERIKVDGYTFRPGEDDSVAFNSIAAKYFAVTGTPLLLGRDFNERDTGASSPAAIVNETFVRTFFGGRAPLGRHVTSNNVVYEIVGVVKDAKESLRKGVASTMYVPWLQQGDMGVANRTQPMGYSYLARLSSGDPMRLSPLMERAIPEIDSAMRLWFPKTLEDYVDRTTLNERMMATLGGFFGLLALMVACLGIFGILAFQVSRRTNEIGVRVALGATRGSIVALVLREVAMLLVPGCAAGALAAACLARFANSFLFGVTPTDPTAFALAAGALASATLAAGFLPAMRAARVEPMAALRCD